METKDEKEKEKKHLEFLAENKRRITAIVEDIRKNVPTRLYPHPNRIICYEYPLGTIKTESGLERSATYKAGLKKDQQMELVRYFVVAFGDNAKGLSFNGKRMAVGDELIHCLVPSVVRHEMPLVTDYAYLDDTGKVRHFASFDIAEIHSIIKH